jgi:hypothetical protein
MTFLGSAMETVVTMTSIGFACWKGEDLLIRLGWMKHPLEDEMSVRPKAPPPPRPTPAKPFKLWSDEQARLAAASFVENPAAFWLDPNLWGDDPNWRERLFPVLTAEHDPRMYPPPPPSPAEFRPGSTMDYMLTDDEWRKQHCKHVNTAWRLVRWPHSGITVCEDCGSEWKADGPPGDDSFPPLPCGCPWETPIQKARAPYTGWHFSICDRCGAEWEPPSNDPTGRKLGQGERVYPGGYVAKSDTPAIVEPKMAFRAVMKDEWGDEILTAKDKGDLPRGSCPTCGRSHPECHVPLNPFTADGWGDPFLKCAGCSHTWDFPYVQNENGTWRKKRTAAEIRARNKAAKKARLAKRHDYDNDMPPPPRSR